MSSRSGSSPAENGNAGGLLRASDGINAVVSAVGDYLSSWSALDGKLIWENWFSNAKVVDLELLELEDANARAGSRDSIVLFNGDAGVVRRIDGDSGNVKWEYKDDRLVFVSPLLLGSLANWWCVVVVTSLSKCRLRLPISITSLCSRLC